MTESALRITELEVHRDAAEPTSAAPEPQPRLRGSLLLKDQTIATPLDFRNVIFSGDVVLEDVRLNAGCTFAGAKFQSRVIFRNVTVRASKGNSTIFQNCTFHGHTRFERCSLYLADFSNSKFRSQTYFNSTKFNASTTFDGVEFNQPAHFKQAIFSGIGSFKGTRFLSTAEFASVIFRYSASHARFHSTIFTHSADFESAKFCGHAEFVAAHFNGGCTFVNTHFSENDDEDDGTTRDKPPRRNDNRADLRITFKDAVFQSDYEGGIATFQGAKFGDRNFPRDTEFDGAQFHIGSAYRTITTGVTVDFSDCDWFGALSFRNAIFNSDVNATFDRSRLDDDCDLSEAQFNGDATFERLHARHGIIVSGTTFSRIPDFQQATLTYPPKLDLAIFPSHLAPASKDERNNILRRLRTLRKLAVQSEDRKTEYAMLVQEFKHDGGVTSALYGLISNYGQSWWRPAAWLILLTVTLFPLLYLGAYWRVPLSVNAATSAALALHLPCKERSGNSLAAALELSVRNASIVAAGNEGRREHITECLAGTSLTGFSSVAAAVLEATQIVLTAVFVFFIGSSVRRRLQMR